MDKRAYEDEMKELATIGKCLKHYEERRNGNKEINDNFRDRAFRLIDIAYKHLPDGVNLINAVYTEYRRQDAR